MYIICLVFTPFFLSSLPLNAKHISLSASTFERSITIDPLSLIIAAHVCLRIWSPTEKGQPTCDYFSKNYWLLFSRKPSRTISSPVRLETLMALLPSKLEFLTFWLLCRSCAHNHSGSELYNSAIPQMLWFCSSLYQLTFIDYQTSLFAPARSSPQLLQVCRI